MKTLLRGLLGFSLASSLFYGMAAFIVGFCQVAPVQQVSIDKRENTPNRTSKKSLVGLLVEDPSKVLQSCDTVRREFYKAIYDNDLESKEYQGIQKKFEEKNPIFFLHECTDEYCVLDRYGRPQHRERFENEAVKILTEKLNSLHPISYVSFASGGLFQDLVIVSKALTQYPDASLVMHVIDNEYKCYTTCRDYIGDGRSITSESAIDPCGVMDKLKEHAYKNIKAQDVPRITDADFGKGMAEEDIYIGNTFDIESEIISECMSTEQTPKQFISYLQSAFPHATLSFYIHKSVASYLQYVQQNKLAFPDIIVAADIHNFQSALRAYKKLCIEAFRKNATATSVWLTQWMWIGAQVHSMSTTKGPGSQKETFELEDGTSLPVYVKTIPIVDAAFKKEYETNLEFRRLCRS